MGRRSGKVTVLAGGWHGSQSLLGKKETGRLHCLLISTPLEPGNLDSSSDFARDSS